MIICKKDWTSSLQLSPRNIDFQSMSQIIDGNCGACFSGRGSLDTEIKSFVVE